MGHVCPMGVGTLYVGDRHILLVASQWLAWSQEWGQAPKPAEPRPDPAVGDTHSLEAGPLAVPMGTGTVPDTVPRVEETPRWGDSAVREGSCPPTHCTVCEHSSYGNKLSSVAHRRNS